MSLTPSFSFFQIYYCKLFFLFSPPPSSAEANAVQIFVTFHDGFELPFSVYKEGTSRGAGIYVYIVRTIHKTELWPLHKTRNWIKSPEAWSICKFYVFFFSLYFLSPCRSDGLGATVWTKIIKKKKKKREKKNMLSESCIFLQEKNPDERHSPERMQTNILRLKFLTIN